MSEIEYAILQLWKKKAIFGWEGSYRSVGLLILSLERLKDTGSFADVKLFNGTNPLRTLWTKGKWLDTMMIAVPYQYCFFFQCLILTFWQISEQYRSWWLPRVIPTIEEDLKATLRTFYKSTTHNNTNHRATFWVQLFHIFLNIFP